jgi:YD repeat-containing protein
LYSGSTVPTHTLTGNAQYQQGGGVSFISEVTTSASSTGRFFEAGADNTVATGSTARKLTAQFDGNKLYAVYRDTSGVEQRVEMTTTTKLLKDNTTYVVQVGSSGVDLVLNVYEKGQQQAGFSYRPSPVQGDWGVMRGFWSAKGTSTTANASSVLRRAQEVQWPNYGTSNVTGVTYRYDALGRLRAVVDGTAQIAAQTLYDVAGRKVADIDATGALTEYVYDAAGRQVQSIEYSQRLTPAQLATVSNSNGSPFQVALSTLRPTTDASARITTSFYDAAGQLVGVQDADGYLTENRYDGAGRLTDVTRYATATAVSLTPATTVASVRPGSDPTNDRVERRFYDASGLLRGVLDGEGYLSEYEYDAAGRQVALTRYFQATPIAARATGDLNALRPAKDLKDLRTLWLYDVKGQKVGEVDAEGYFTETTYDLNGRVLSTARYDKQVKPPVYSASGVQYVDPATLTLAALRSTGVEVQTTAYVYNAQGQLTRLTAPNGTATDYVYDINGRLVRQTVAANDATQARASLIEYNTVGWVTREVDSLGNYLLEQDDTLARTERQRLLGLGAPLALASMTTAQRNTLNDMFSVRYAYDTAGRRISAVNGRGYKTLYYYDTQGRLTHTIDAEGEVKVSVYNSFGEVESTRAYANRLDATTLGTLTGGLNSAAALTTALSSLADATRDIQSSSSYTLRGAIKDALDELGNKTSATYNAFGQVSTTQAQLGDGTARVLNTTLLYDRRGLAKSQRSYGDAIDATVQTAYDAFGRAQTTTDARGKPTTTAYDKLGRVVTVTDPLSRLQRTAYDAFDRVLTQWDGLGNPTTTVYDTANRRMTVTTPEGVTLITEVNRHGEVVKFTDGNGNVTLNEYDAKGELTRSTQAQGQLDLATQNTYGAGGLVMETKDANGVVTRFEYDKANRVTKKVVDSAPGGLALTTIYTIDAFGRTYEVTDPNGVVTHTDFDAAGRVKAVIQDYGTGKLNLTTAYTYDAAGHTLRVTEGSGAYAKVTKYDYDAAGRRTKETVDPDGTLKLTTSYAYDRAGNVIERTDALGYKTRFVYDDAGQLVYTIDPTGAVSLRSYDANGRVVATTSYANRIVLTSLPVLPDPATGYTLAQITITTSPLDRTERTIFNKDGQAIYSVDGLGYVTRRDFDKAGNVVSTYAYAKPVAITSSDKAALELALQPDVAADRQTYTVYDAANRAVVDIDALKYATTYTYDKAGHVLSRKRGYNPITVPTTRTPATVASAVAAVAHAKDRTSYAAYDAAGRQRYAIDAERYVTEYRYDADGRQRYSIRYDARITVPGTVTEATVKANLPGSVGAADVQTETRYDAAGRVTDTVDGLGMVTHIDYDAAGRQQAKTTAAGLPEQIKTTYDYDAAGRLLQENHAAGTSLQYVTQYQYDTNGNLTKLIEPRGSEITTQDTAWAAAERQRTGYPASAASLTQPQKDALKALYTTEYQYDAAGNRIKTITAPGTAISGTTTTVFNAFGQATSVTDPRSAVTYNEYDALGRKVRVVDAERNLTANTYDAFGNLTDVTHYAAKVTGDASLGVKVLKTGDTAPTSGGYLYADAVVDAREQTQFDQLDRVKGAIDAEAKSETSALNAFGERETVTNKLGGTASFTYDSLGRTLTETLPVQSRNASNVLVNVVNRYEYDARGNRTKSIEAEGLPEARVTTFVFDKADRQVQKIGTAFSTYDAVTGSSTATPVDVTRYDGNGNVIESVSNANLVGGVPKDGARTLSYYDAAGRKTVQIAADGAYTAYTYSTDGRVFKESAYATRVTLGVAGGNAPAAPTASPATDRITTSFYDGLGRLVETRRDGVIYWEQPTGNGDDIQLNLQGSQPTTITLQKRVYDAAGNVVQEVDSRGNSAFHYYDKIGRQVFSIDQEGYATAWEFAGYTTQATKETRYATKLPDGTYSASSHPAASTTAQDRVTTYKLDRLARITEQRVLNVAYEYVDAAGVRTQGTADAVTGLTYDGLGNVTQRREQVSASVVNTTDNQYDKLGRQIRTQAPGYTDFNLTAVRPTTDTEYDGLGNVKREIQRGTNDAAETDDRITVYGYNFNGDRIQVTDANGNVTQFELNSLRQVSRSTAKNVKDADGGLRDVAKTFQYDALGRQIVQTDVSTGEVRKTAYNAFGEISGKSLGDGWQEFIEYTTLGKVQKSNTGDGVTKIYLYDTNGNATRQISSPDTDLTNVSVATAAQTATFLHTFSLYDKRNLLTKTVEPKIEYQKDKVSMTQAFTQQLAPVYGAISVGNATGATYTQGSVDGSGYGYTQVSATGSPTSMLSPKPVIPNITRSDSDWNIARPLPTSGAMAFSIDWSGGASVQQIGMINWPVSFTVPSSTEWLDVNYRLVQKSDGHVIKVLRKGETGEVWISRGIDAINNFEFQMEISPGYWVMISSLQTVCRASYNTRTKTYFYSGSKTSTEPLRLLVPVTDGRVSSLLATIKGGSLDGVNPPVSRLYDVNGNLVPSYFVVDLSSYPGQTFNVLLKGLDASGGALVGDLRSVTVGDGCALSTPTEIIDADFTVTTNSSPYQRIIRFNQGAIGGAGSGTIYVREKGTTAGWPFSASFGGGSFDISLLHLPLNKPYEFIVNTGNKESYGEFSLDANEVPTVLNGGMLRTVNRPPAMILTFDLGGTLTAGGPYLMDLQIGNVTITGKSISGTSADFTVDTELAGLGVTRYANKSFDYTYRVYTAAGTTKQRFVGQGSGNVQLGSEFLQPTAPSTSSYQPIITFNTALAGTLTLRVSGQDTKVTMGSAGDWRRLSSSSLDLSQWFIPGTTQNVDVFYQEASDANFTASYQIGPNGAVTCQRLTSIARQPKVTLSIPGSTQLTVLNAGANDNDLHPVSISPPSVISSGSTYVWDASTQPRDVWLRFYYESVNSSGLVGKGYGSLRVISDGTIQYSMDRALLQPSYIRFTPPSGATRFELQYRVKNSSGAYTTLGNLPVDNGAWVLDATNPTNLRPTTGSADYECLYMAWDASDKVVSKGSGSFTVNSDGTSSAALVSEVKHTMVTLQGPPNKQVAKMRFDFGPRGSAMYPPVYIDGVWDGSRSTFTWDADAYTPKNGSTAEFDYVVRMLDGNGNPFTNEVGDPLTMSGVMTLGGGLSKVDFKQYITKLAQSAQIKHLQTYNAFGEVADEFDDNVVARAQEMVQRYGGTVDTNALHTTFAYNTLGQLVTKTDPQTHITKENGYRYRASPVTQYGYDLTGRLTTSTDANGNTSLQSYLGEGERMGGQWAADGGNKKAEYDTFGQARKLTNQLGNVTLQNYDNLGQLTQVQRLGITRAENFTGADAVASTLTDSYDYDALGQRIKHTNALLWVDKTYYDNLGRVVKTVTPEGRSTSYSYTFVAAGGGLLGLGNKSVGGYQLKTTSADGRFTYDNIEYFGHTTWHQDMGGRMYLYNYDLGGRLASQTSSAGQNIQYAYYANGYIREMKDLAERTLSRYGYDNAGNRVWEAYSGLASDNINPEGSYQSNTISYDELNRMSHVKDDLAADIQYEYDAVGNRRAVHAGYWDPTTLRTWRTDDLWYAYDKVNRFTITKGALNTGTVRGASANDTSVKIVLGTDGIQLSYDRASQRTSALAANGTLEEYTYSADGYLEDTYIKTSSQPNRALAARRRNDALGRTLENKDVTNSKSRVTTYDRDNRVLKDIYDGTTTTYFYFTDTTDNDATATQAGAGSLAHTVAVPSSGPTVTTTYRYEYWDDAKQSTIKIAANWAPGASQLTYDVNGHLKMAYDNGAGITTNYFSNAQGLIMRRDTVQAGTNVGSQYYYYADGHRVGEVTNDPNNKVRLSYAESLAIKDKSVDRKTLYKNFQPVTSADFDQNYEPINDSYPAAVSGSYTVRGGETLQSIARTLWGDAQMWYLLAEANGLTGQETLVAGRVLVIPNKVTNIHNNASTFRPYNPGEAIGRIDPTLPAPPPPPKKGSGGIAQIIMIVVAVVVTIYTAGAAASAFGALGTAGAGGFAGGMAALGGAGGLAGFAGAVVGGAVGSIASQGVGMAMGVQSKFSWKQVGLSALGSGVTAGVGAGLDKLGVLSNLSTNATLQAGLSAGVKGAAGAAMTQGLQGKWNWTGIAASAAGSAAGAAAGAALNGTQLGNFLNAGNGFGTRLVSGMAGTAVSQLVGSGRIDPRSAFANTLGNALGESLAERPQVAPSYALTGSDLKFGESGNLVKFGGTGGAAEAPVSAYSGGQAWAADVAARRAAASEQQLEELLASVGAHGVSINTERNAVAEQRMSAAGKSSTRSEPDSHLAGLRAEIADVTSGQEAKKLAARFQADSRQLYDVANTVEENNPEAAQLYRRMASNNVVASGQAARMAGRFTTSDGLPRPFTNPEPWGGDANNWSMYGGNAAGVAVSYRQGTPEGAARLTSLVAAAPVTVPLLSTGAGATGAILLGGATAAWEQYANNSVNAYDVMDGASLGAGLASSAQGLYALAKQTLSRYSSAFGNVEMLPSGAGMTKLDIAAENGYQRIRDVRMADVRDVSENAGLSLQEATTLKKHLFFGRHEYPIDGTTVVRARFVADHEIAYAWQTAAKGPLSDGQREWFNQLAQHELTERSFMANGVPYLQREAWTGSSFGTMPPGAHNLAPKPPSTTFPGYNIPMSLLGD